MASGLSVTGGTGSGALVDITVATGPYSITTGPDGNVWFTENNTNVIAKITTAGAITQYSLPNGSSRPVFITNGPDGNLWFTDRGTGNIGRITTSGTVTEFPPPTTNAGPWDITLGP
jgi:virginiamycin B lyase